MSDDAHPARHPSDAAATLRIGTARLRARVDVTPTGLLAIGGLVAAILWSVPPIIRAAGDVRRINR